VGLDWLTTPDPHAGLPEQADLGKFQGDLGLYDDSISRMETEWKIAQAMKGEEVALAADARLTNSEGASFDSYLGSRVFANSLGFAGEYRTSSCGLSVVPVPSRTVPWNATTGTPRPARPRAWKAPKK
jgi:PmbA protein